ncbi:MAG: tryptophan--tRNA ligase, partial [Candidatus Peregrinibacteria bacterium]|nr:tryptophan--tRNA ligase [Candidatus Peregrinibacteria bacterium]
IGNYFGAIKPMVDLQNEGKHEMFFFLADLHAFTTKRSAEEFSENQRNAVLDFLACGLDPEKSLFYRQSDIPAHTELSWFLACRTPMGLLERAHSFKDKKAKGLDTNAGLFTYPVLMAADILLYSAAIVPVGKDQKQHVEMARDIAQKFNHEFGETFVLPESKIDENVMTIPGLDGEKMSKSYGNTIPIFAEEKVLKKKIMSIETDSVELGQPLNPETCNVFAFHKLFDNPDLGDLRTKYVNGGIGFGDSKKMLFELVWNYFADARERRAKLADDPKLVEEILRKGAEKASEIANEKLADVREKLGLAPKHLV